jgi:Fe2+ transport system protein FeoA
VVLSPTRSKAYQCELYRWLISLGCNGGTPFYLKQQRRVNPIFVFVLEAHCAGRQNAAGIRLKFYGHL